MTHVPAPHSRADSAGFSLIELIIAISIIAILTVVAIPAYQQYVLRANRATVKALLVKISQDQEAWFGDRKTYTSLNTLYGGTGTSSSSLYTGNDGVLQQSASSSTLYAITLTRAASTSVAVCPYSQSNTTGGPYDYVVVATPLATGVQNKDTTCMTICLSNTGIRGASGTGGTATCWQR